MSFARCEISLFVSFFLNSVIIGWAAVLFPLRICFTFIVALCIVFFIGASSPRLTRFSTQYY